MGLFSRFEWARMDVEIPSAANVALPPEFRSHPGQISSKAPGCPGSGKVVFSILPRPSFPRSKEGLRRKEGNFRSFTAQPAHSLPEVQNDIDIPSAGSHPQAGMDDFGRCERRLLARSNREELPEVPRLRPQWPEVHVPGYAIRSLIGSQDVHKALQRPDTGSTYGRGEHSSLSRRRYRVEQHEGRLPGCYHKNAETSQSPRFPSELEEKQTSAIPKIQTSGPVLGYEQGIHQSPNQTDIQCNFSGKKGCQGRKNLQTTVATNFGQGELHLSFGSSSPMHFQVLAGLSTDKTSEESSSVFAFPSRESSQTIVNPLAKRTEDFRNDAHAAPSNHNDCVHGLVVRGLGLPHRLWPLQSRNLDIHSQGAAYQHKRIGGGSLRSERTQASPEGYASQSSVRQLSNSIHPKETGISQITCAEQLGINYFSTSASTRLVPDSASHPGENERLGGPAFQDYSGSDGVGAGPSILQLDMSPTRSTPGGSVCDQTEREIGNIHFSLSGQSGLRNRCISSRLEPMGPNLFVSASESSFEGFSEAGGISGNCSHRSSLLGPSALVSDPHEDSETSENSQSSPGTDCPGDPLLRYLSISETPSRLDFVRSFFAGKYSENAARFLSADIRGSSIRQYESIFKSFITFLKETEVRDLKASVFMDFFIFCFETQNLAPSTIASYRSSLKPIAEISGIDLTSSHFDSLIRSFRIKRPAMRTSFISWDLDNVLEFIVNFRNPINPSFLLRKTAFLLQLALGCRISELSGLSRNKNLTKFLEDGSVSILGNPNQLRKHEFSDKRDEPFIVPPLKNPDGSTHRLCPVSALKFYITHTGGSAAVQDLFLHHSSPRPLSTRGLAKEIVMLIKDSNPGSFPRSHDVRKIAASVAVFKHMLAMLMKRGHWSSPKTFWRHYNKNIFKLSHSVVTMGQANF